MVKRNYLNKDIVDIGKDITHSIHDASSKIKLPEWNLGLTDGIKDAWAGIVGGGNTKKATPETPVAELRIMLKNELAKQAENGRMAA